MSDADAMRAQAADDDGEDVGEPGATEGRGAKRRRSKGPAKKKRRLSEPPGTAAAEAAPSAPPRAMTTPYIQDSSTKEEVDYALACFLERLRRDGIAGDASAAGDGDDVSDSDSDGDGELQATPEALELMRFFHTLGSAFFLAGQDGFNEVMRIFEEKVSAAVHSDMSRKALQSLHQVLRHVHGFTAVRYAGLPSGHDTQPTDAVMRRFERMLKTFEKEHGLQ
uniref:Uncharacterized protein n=1 Tax=Eutreptiella gymnastica TaxID=73025 RepID=A0A7S4G773_9EUGL